jgi:hypothetical protein
MACIAGANFLTPRSFAERRPRLLIMIMIIPCSLGLIASPFPEAAQYAKFQPEWADQTALVLLGHIILGSHSQ